MGTLNNRCRIIIGTTHVYTKAPGIVSQRNGTVLAGSLRKVPQQLASAVRPSWLISTPSISKSTSSSFHEKVDVSGAVSANYRLMSLPRLLAYVAHFLDKKFGLLGSLHTSLLKRCRLKALLSQVLPKACSFPDDEPSGATSTALNANMAKEP